jgi:hypothetical protein
MKLFECALCGRRVEAKDWPYCSVGHPEGAMYEILRFSNQEQAGLLTSQ